ncbi:MAG: family 43 glycosylhydrolase [Methylotenera sp.]|nr:family 43 glycosylhydrolase [Oligoflexia bacterium]
MGVTFRQFLRTGVSSVLHSGFLYAAVLVFGCASLGYATSYRNPVMNADFPDPSILRASDGTFYAYATQTLDHGRLYNIQVSRSKNLVEWTPPEDALPVKPKWASRTQQFWAPDVKEHDGIYFMYFSAQRDHSDGLCLGVAFSKNPLGPFTDKGSPLLCGKTFENIDPMAFDDPATGKKLIYWGSGFKALRVQELAENRLEFRQGSVPVELVAPVPLPRGLSGDDPRAYFQLIEGSWILLHDGTYYLFFSGDNCCGERAHYGVMVARSRSALGPFEVKKEPILRANSRWNAPGHNSVFRDADGVDWMFYHAIDRADPVLSTPILGDRRDRRILLMDRLVYEKGWPSFFLQSPSTTFQQGPKL